MRACVLACMLALTRLNLMHTGRLLNHVPGDESVRPGVHDGFENGEDSGVEEAQQECEEEECGADGGQQKEVDGGCGAEASGGGEGLGPKKQRGGHGLIYVDLNATRAALYSHCRSIAEFLEEGAGACGGAARDRSASVEREEAEAGREQGADASMADYMIPDADLMKWKGYVFDIVTPTSKRWGESSREEGERA